MYIRQIKHDHTSYTHAVVHLCILCNHVSMCVLLSHRSLKELLIPWDYKDPHMLQHLHREIVTVTGKEEHIR